jgi:hypothetical protein
MSNSRKRGFAADSVRTIVMYMRVHEVSDYQMSKLAGVSLATVQRLRSPNFNTTTLDVMDKLYRAMRDNPRPQRVPRGRPREKADERASAA